MATQEATSGEGKLLLGLLAFFTLPLWIGPAVAFGTFFLVGYAFMFLLGALLPD
jgi:hypothetical protein